MLEDAPSVNNVIKIVG